jgi:hypothetical protein
MPGGATSDDVSKWKAFGRHAVIVVAGNALLAAYICDGILAKLPQPDDRSYNEVKAVFESDLEEISRQFNVDTGRYTHCTIMLSGYDLDSKDDVDAAKLGEVMAAGVKAKGDGVSVQQNIDAEIIKGMSYQMTMAELMHKPLGVGDRVTINRPKSELTAYEIVIDQAGVHIQKTEADTFEALIYGADTAVNKLELPTETISNIYFRDISGQNAAEVMTGDGIHLIAFIKTTIEQRNYTNVGGNVVPLLITPELTAVGSGQVGRLNLRTKKVDLVGDIEVRNGKLHYKDYDGTYKPFRSLKDIRQQAGLTQEFQI